ncbi:MAG TPA: hypothetical protein VLM05_02365 [Mycobacteriales bacterium]|nr:hypothetical protein [Mycobacteriales bacterium]
MELTDRERRILAEIENQFPGAPRPVRSGFRPQWTVIPSAVLGVLLFVAGIVLGLGNSLLAGMLLLCWWLFPSRSRLRQAGRRASQMLTGNEPPRTTS